MRGAKKLKESTQNCKKSFNKLQEAISKKRHPATWRTKNDLFFCALHFLQVKMPAKNHFLAVISCNWLLTFSRNTACEIVEKFVTLRDKIIWSLFMINFSRFKLFMILCKQLVPF